MKKASKEILILKKKKIESKSMLILLGTNSK